MRPAADFWQARFTREKSQWIRWAIPRVKACRRSVAQPRHFDLLQRASGHTARPSALMSRTSSTRCSGARRTTSSMALPNTSVVVT
jgi:hypothetical protein